MSTVELNSKYILKATSFEISSLISGLVSEYMYKTPEERLLHDTHDEKDVQAIIDKYMRVDHVDKRKIKSGTGARSGAMVTAHYKTKTLFDGLELAHRAGKARLIRRFVNMISATINKTAGTLGLQFDSFDQALATMEATGVATIEYCPRCISVKFTRVEASKVFNMQLAGYTEHKARCIQ